MSLPGEEGFAGAESCMVDYVGSPRRRISFKTSFVGVFEIDGSVLP